MEPSSRNSSLVVLWRILGNDIVPRHAPGQTRQNLEFILRHEADFSGGEKRFLLNRIMDPAEVDKIRALLERWQVRYDTIPFSREEYLAQRTVEERVRYITNVNGARNHCIKVGLTLAPVVLPFDGNCFFTSAGWQSFFDIANQNRDAAGFVVPLWRLRDNRQALRGSRKPQIKETIGRRFRIWPIRQLAEPQLGFTRSSDVRFDEELAYPRCDKAELLWRLGIPGPWQEWSSELRQQTAKRNGVSKYHGELHFIPTAGFVCRLSSGNPRADARMSFRVAARRSGLGEITMLADKTCGRLS